MKTGVELAPLQQELHRLELGKQRITRLAILLAHLGNRWIAYLRDATKTKVLDQSASRIVHVPARHDHDQTGVLAEA